MHSGSFISPKHPAIPVSIGIASIVLEGRPAVIDGTSSSSSSSRTGTDGGGAGPGGGGGPDEDGGFFRSSNSSMECGGAGGAVECHSSRPSFSVSDAAKRINLKLQQIRSCPGTSKDVVENMVTVEAGAASSSGDYDNYGVETYVSETSRSSETTPLVFSAKAWSRDHIYSGFEKMKLMGAVSPIKVPPAAAAMSTFINFSAVNSKKKLEISGGSGSGGSNSSRQRTREGPHCEQFLKKVGVIKIDPAEEAEHSCSYRNEFCLRWQSYLKQLSSLLTTGEAICIEVYLGPENDAILLEQWILKLKIKSSDSTMTLQSLCAAIRSQLYFSQISAWTDLIKNSLEPEIYNHPRIKKASSASTSVGGGNGGVGGSGETSPVGGLPRAKLDILFRIRGYDNTACFNETPNVHNFPDAIVADNYVIEVCLKSLPRMERIPRIHDEMDTKMDESLVSDRIDRPCHEKGKHRCTFRVEDEEDPGMGEDGEETSSAAMSHREKQLLKYKKRMMKREKKKKALESGGSGSSVGSSEAVPMVVAPPVCKSPALNIPVPTTTAATTVHGNNCGVPPAYTSSINLIQPPLYSNCDDLYQAASCATNNTKATQTAIFLSLSSSGTVSATVATQTDASGCCCLCANNPQQQPAATMSTNSDSKMQYIHSNNLRRDYTSSNCDTSQPEVDAVISQRRREESKGLRKAELLLQAIQRTAIINDHHQPTAAADEGDDVDAAAHFSNNNYYSGSYNDNNNVGSDTAKCERSECDTFTFNKEPLDLGDCRLCKRQKTKHNFKLALSDNSKSDSGSESSESSTNNSPPGCRRTLSESLVGHFTLPSSSSSLGGAKHCATKRDGGADDDDDIDDLSEGRLSTSTGAVDNGGTLSFEQLKSYRRAFSEDVIDTISLNGGQDFQQCGCAKSTLKHGQCSSLFVTPHTTRLPPTSTPAAAAASKAPLFVNCAESDCSVSTASSVSPHKKQILSCTAVSAGAAAKPTTPSTPGSVAYYTIPKINLTNIFNVSPLAREDSGFASTSSPIPIDETATSGVFNFCESRLMVQKSSSAPTCHLSPGSLSPRFLRHAYKHQRSRYLSERSSVSERSSIGSDEQLSEDEYPFLPDSNGTSYGSNFHLSPSTTPLSPLKFGSAQQRPFSRSFSKNLFKFGRSPLLGTLEESLLQRRILPKFQVADFKVLLGASGSFCPTQLTIPVASYFYELPGQHLSTPYVCELRLPRKGYSIPRQGTVQVTLLNPLGTVVRMFVVPYDFRDMPAMSTTFIRQRILAYDDSAKSASMPAARNVEQLSNAEQMKLLRYAIHLRFQTSRSGKLSLHTDIRLLISRRTDCDTAAAHAKNLLEAPNELKVVTIVPENPKFSLRLDKQ